MSKAKTVDLTSGPILKTLAELALPIMISSMLGTAYSIMDMAWIGLLGASAMAGYVGGGGVGDLALTYGYQRMNTPLMIFTVVVLVVFVQILQLAGNTISRKLRQHR
jgi:D-methionine transport system permease protein